MSTQLKDLIIKAKKQIDPSLDTKKLEAEAFSAPTVEGETKANEVMHTTNTGYGAELVGTITEQPILDQIVSYSRLLPMLPGNHGNGMGKSVEVPVIGEAVDFEGTSELTGSPATTTTATANNVPTGKVTITQSSFILKTAISDQEMMYATGNVEAILRDRITKSAGKTIDKLIINGDDATSGNVNFDGGTPATTSYYLKANNMIRDKAIAGSNTVDVSTMSDGDFLSLLAKVGNYGSMLNDLLWIMPMNVYLKALGLDAVKTQDKFGPNATFATGVLAKAYGIDILVTDCIPNLAQATGKVSNTGGSNTVGQMALVYKPAIQYGFGKPLQFELERIYGYGFNVVASMDFGVAMAYETAGLSKTAALGVNITI